VESRLIGLLRRVAMELMPAEQVLLGKTFAFASKFWNEAAMVMYAAHDPISQCKAIMRGDKEAAHKEPLTAISSCISV
jgi:hypothetical protein